MHKSKDPSAKKSEDGQSQMVGGSYEKEDLPINLADIRSLRTIFEKDVPSHKHQLHTKHQLHSDKIFGGSHPQLTHSRSFMTQAEANSKQHTKHQLHSGRSFGGSTPQLNHQQSHETKAVNNAEHHTKPQLHSSRSFGGSTPQFNHPRSYATHAEDNFEHHTKHQLHRSFGGSNPEITQPKAHISEAEDGVDCSQPSMAELLDKFRRLEMEGAKVRIGQHHGPSRASVDGYTQRCSSLDRRGNLTYEKKHKESTSVASNRMSIDERLLKTNSEVGIGNNKRNSTHVPSENKSLKLKIPHSNDYEKNPENCDEFHVSVDTIKLNLGLAPAKRSQVILPEVDTKEDLPTEGMVKTLLSQWRTIEASVIQTRRKKVRFGVDSSWLPDEQSILDTNSSRPKKSCLRLGSISPSPTKDKSNVFQTNAEKDNTAAARKIHVEGKGSGHPDVVLHTSETKIKDEVVNRDREHVQSVETELPPPSNTKSLLEKFKALERHTTSSWLHS